MQWRIQDFFTRWRGAVRALGDSGWAKKREKEKREETGEEG